MSFFDFSVIKGIGAVFIRASAICLIVASLYSYAYFNVWFDAAARYNSEEVTIAGEITDVVEKNYGYTATLECNNVNNDIFSSYKLLVYLDFEDINTLTSGSTVTIRGAIEEFNKSANFDAKSYYTSLGYSAVITDVSFIEILSTSNSSLNHKLSTLKTLITDKIIKTSDGEAGGLLSALLLGEREYLTGQAMLDFSRSGLSHVLALSGMHLAILSMGLSKLLSLLGLGKKSSTVATLLFTLFYMGLTGFSVSVVRAGIMLISSSLLFLLSSTRDSITSLAIAVSIIVIIEPFAIFSLSLLLSAFATLGILIFGELLSRKNTKPSLGKWVSTSLLASVFAIGATLPLTVLNFDGISLASAITTLVISPLVYVFLYLGILHVILGSIIPTGILLAPIARLMLHIVSAFSDVNFLYVSTGFTATRALTVILCIILISFLVFKVKRKGIFLTALALIMTSVFGTAILLTELNEEKTDMLYSTSNGERIIIKEDGEITVVDFAFKSQSASFNSLDEIFDLGLTRVNSYILASYNKSLPSSLYSLLTNIKVDKLYLPTPKNDIEAEIYNSIKLSLKGFRAEIVTYQLEDVIRNGDFSVIPVYNRPYGESKYNDLMLSVVYQDELYTYLTKGSLNSDKKDMAFDLIAGSHTIIFGRHESNSIEYKFSYVLDGVSAIIFSDKNITVHADSLEHYDPEKIYFSPKEISLIH